jgi:hypothetical protein
VAKAKKCVYDVIDRDSEPEPWLIFDRVLNAHHAHLSEVRFVLMWRREMKPDADRKITLGASGAVGAADKEYANRDWKIILNQTAWKDFSDIQREAVMAGMLCRCSIVATRDGECRRDEHDRLVLRKRKPDIMEFTEIVKEYGLYTSDLVKFAEACADKRRAPLFADLPEEAAANGEAPSGRKSSKPRKPRKPRRAKA